MKTAYFDCIAGAAGDMIIGALINAGLDADALRKQLNLLHLNDYELKISKVKKNGFAATKFDVVVKDDVPERHLAEIRKIIEDSSIQDNIKTKSMEIFTFLCECEAKMHNSTPDKVHLHELGGVDTIVDVVGTLLGLEMLGIEKIECSPLPVGRGFVKGAHGQIPLPAPATAEILKGIPVYGVEVQKELITPTGAVLLRFLAEKYGPIPTMIISEIGYGAGTRDMEIPNLIRVFIGEAAHKGHSHSHTHAHTHTEALILLETNIDDQNPEIFDHVMSKLLGHGALDVFFTSIQMKKNRPAVKLSALCKGKDADVLEKIIFKETSTTGIRRQTILRDSLQREIKTIKLAVGEVRIKVVKIGENECKYIPEYDDCKKLATDKNIPLIKIYNEALAVAQLKFS